MIAIAQNSAQPAYRSVHAKLRAAIRSPYFWLGLLVVAFLLFGIDPVHAADAQGGNGGGNGLPWEAPMKKLRDSISGPIAFGIALLGIIATGATLIWGGEISEFTRRIIYVVLVVCIIVFANSMLTGTLFSGATIPAGAAVSPADLAGYVGAR